MKPPPLLIGAALLFWGWQSDFFPLCGAMAIALEGARVIKTRWEFTDEDFSRIFTFCSLLFLGSAVYAFTSNQGPSSFAGFFQDPNVATQREAAVSGQRSASAFFRWWPMIFFPFIAAQMFSARETIPLTTMSLILRRRWKKSLLTGKPAPVGQGVHVGYPYFAACLFAASVHPTEDTSFFWGFCGLMTWALWTQRSRRFGFVTWLCALATVVALAYYGQLGLSQFQRYLGELTPPSWLTRWMRRTTDPTQNKTALGRIGELKLSGTIVIWLETKEGSQPPTYLREASYRNFRVQTWSAGGQRDEFVDNVNEEVPNSGTWLLLPFKTNTIARVNIACYLEGWKLSSPAGLLPLPTGSARLENFRAYVLHKNSTGAVLAEGPGLVMFDALYGPGPTIDSDADGEDLIVPPREEAALDKLIDEMQLNGKGREEALRIIAAFFAEKFTYRTWQPPPKPTSTNDTPLSRFLLETRAGHCEYFATATALLLRKLHIPTRYAVGYSVHEGSGANYVVRLRDAHAWCLVWDERRKRWSDFDTTPASWVAEENKHASSFQWLSDFWSRLKFEISKFRWGQGRLREYLLWIMVPALLVLLYQIFFRRRGRKARDKTAAQAQPLERLGLDSEFYELEKNLTARGVPRGEGETLAHWLERLTQQPGVADLRPLLLALLRLHYRHRFDPLGLSTMDRDALRRETRACLEKLAQAEHGAVR